MADPQKISAPGIGEYELSEPEAPQSIAGTVGNMLTNPEVLSGAASMIPGVGTGAAGLIGAGTSIGRDLYKGERDPMTIGGHAALHGGLSMIPGGVGKLVEMGSGAMAPLAEGAASLAGGSKVAAIARMIKSAIGIGQGAAPAAEAANPILSMELPFGVKVASEEGLQTLKGELTSLANKGAAYGHPQFDAIDALIKQVEQHLSTAQDAASVTGRLGVPVTTAASRAEHGAAMAADAAKTKGASIANKLRLLIGAGSAAGSGASGSW